jgi:hypothetical protein
MVPGLFWYRPETKLRFNSIIMQLPSPLIHYQILSHGLGLSSERMRCYTCCVLCSKQKTCSKKYIRAVQRIRSKQRTAETSISPVYNFFLHLPSFLFEQMHFSSWSSSRRYTLFGTRPRLIPRQSKPSCCRRQPHAGRFYSEGRTAKPVLNWIFFFWTELDYYLIIREGDLAS